MFRRAFATAFLTTVLLGFAGSAPAQDPLARTVANTGLFTLYPGFSARLQVVEAGPPQTLPTRVTLRMLDDKNRVVGIVDGEMRPGKVVRLTVKSRPSDDRKGVALRGHATLLTSSVNPTTQRILTLELVNDRTLEVAPVVSCPLAAYDPRPMSGPVGLCGCHVVTDLVPAN